MDKVFKSPKDLDERFAKESEAIKKYIDMGYDPATAQMKANVDVNYGGDFQKNYNPFETYKSPLDQAESLNKSNGYDRARVLNFLENYGDHMTDDAYLDFAKKRGITPGNPDSKRGYYNEYIKNEDFLKEVNDGKEKYGEWDDYEFAGIDDDYLRSYGPVTNGEQYDSYMKWKKENN